MQLIAHRDVREPDLANIESPFFAASKLRFLLHGSSCPPQFFGLSNCSQPAFGNPWRNDELLHEVENGDWLLVIPSGPGPFRPAVRWQSGSGESADGRWTVDESLSPTVRFKLEHVVARIEREKRGSQPHQEILPISGAPWSGILKRYANFFAANQAFPQHLTAAEEKGWGSSIRSLYGGNDTIQNQADITALNETPSVLGVTHGQIFDAMENVVTVAGLIEGGLGLSKLKDLGKTAEGVSSGAHNSASALSSFTNQKLGGSGGNWKTVDEFKDSSVIQQTNRLSCGQACVGMLLGDREVSASQEAIAKFAGDGPTYEAQLAAVLNRLDSPNSRQWTGIGVDAEDIGTFHGLTSTGSWGAQLREKGNKIGHWVVVDGLDDANRVLIRDPWNATKYKMDFMDFQNTWSGFSVWGE